MSEVKGIFDQMMAMKLSELLRLAQTAIETNLDENRKSVIFMALETRLKKRSMLLDFKIDLEEKDMS